MHLAPEKKVYFASDFHLGLASDGTSRDRERKICRWLNKIAEDAQSIYLLGDVFDVWFEYKKVVPRGYTRFLGTLAKIADSGISIDIFTGNHDLWMTDYFEQELGIPVRHKPLDLQINQQTFLIGHGDGLGPGDKGYKLLKKLLRNPMSQFIYRLLHPNLGIGVAQYFSQKGAKHGHDAEPFLGNDKEWLVSYSKHKLIKKHYDYFIFGHRHLALDIEVGPHSRYINLGDWIQYFSYAVYDGKDLTLKYYKENE